jgi:uncharacterized membrane protein YfcA
MSEWILIGIAIGLIAVLVGVVVGVVLWKRRKEGRPEEPDYRAIFFVGLVFVPVGIAIMAATENPGLLGVTAFGIFYMFLGLSNRDKWKEKGKKK